MFLKKEIVHYPLPNQDELESLSVCQEDDLASHWHDMLHRRVIQHNIRIVSLYYRRIHGKRLAELLQLEPARLESELADMVSDGTVYAKMDRPKDIIRFQAPQNAEAVLTDWAGQVDQLLHLVETTSHLIHKEKMASQWKSTNQEYVNQ
jgi:26S proteasome regulatory subunit N5